jgi:hypothetical protein
MVELYLLSLMYLHDIVLNKLSTVTISLLYLYFSEFTSVTSLTYIMCASTLTFRSGLILGRLRAGFIVDEMAEE